MNNGGSVVVLLSSIATIIGQSSFLGNYHSNSSHGGVVTAFQSIVHIEGRCTMTKNCGQFGGAVYATESKIHVHGSTTITYNAANSGGGIYLFLSELNCQDYCNLALSNNSAAEKGGGSYVISSTIKVYTRRQAVLNVIGNNAKRGGGSYLEVNAKIYVLKAFLLNVQAIKFVSNTADYGGAVYVADETNSGTCASSSFKEHSPKTECFLQSVALHNQPYTVGNALITTTFTDDQANISGSTLFGGLLDRCTVSPLAEGVQLHQSRDQWSLIFGYITDMNFKKVKSYPIRVCFCNHSKVNYSYKPPLFRVMKGEIFRVSLVAVDQIAHIVSNTTIISSLNSTGGGVGEGQLTQSTNEACTNLSFSVVSPHMSEELILYPEGPCKDANLSQTRIQIRFSPCYCPIGFQSKATNETKCDCECDLALNPYIIVCIPETNTIVRQGNFWIAYINNSDNSSGYLLYPHCPMNYCYPPSIKVFINQVVVTHSVL